MNAQLEITSPSAELQQLAERIVSQPRPRLTDAEIDAWAAALAEQTDGYDAE